jgi:hypothetical protein
MNHQGLTRRGLSFRAGAGHRSPGAATALSAAAVYLGACSTVHHLSRPPTERDLQLIVAEAGTGSASVDVGTNGHLAVGGLHSEGDRLLWATPTGGQASAETLRQVTLVRRAKGFWEGAAIGAGVGFVTGLAVGVIWNTNCSEGPLIDGEHPQASCPVTENPSLTGGLELGAVLGVLFALPGAIVGGLTGAALGDRVVFTTDPPRR